MNSLTRSSMPRTAVRGLLFLALLAALLAGRHANARAAAQVCGPAMTAGNETELAEAITCFNAAAAPGIAVTLTANILLSAALPDIDNSTAGAALGVDGAAFTVDGDSLWRIFTIAADTTVVLHDLTLSNGEALAGGAIDNSGALTLTAVTVQNNSTLFQGGAINSAGTLIITDSTFDTNLSEDYGGAIYNDGGELTVSSSTFVANSASAGGGAIYSDGQLGISASTFSGNNAISGGTAVHATQGDITYSTFYGNFGSDGTGAVVDEGAANAVTLAASLFKLGVSGDNCGVISGGILTDLGDNISDDATCPTDAGSLAGTDPLLDPLAVNGGPTQTHALQDGSPAIDTIAPTALLAGADSASAPQPAPAVDCIPDVTLDQRGYVRAGGIGEGGASCDSGAFEYGSAEPTAVSLRAFQAGAPDFWSWLRRLLGV